MRGARVEKYAFSLNWSFPSGGTLDFLPGGQQNVEYVATLAALNWDDFYTKLNGGEFLDALRANMKDKYDYTLIDSRTGLTDVADICTVQLRTAGRGSRAHAHDGGQSRGRPAGGRAVQRSAGHGQRHL